VKSPTRIESDNLRTSILKKRVVNLGVLASAALFAVSLSGCVTEEIGPGELHTTAYVEHDATGNSGASNTYASQPSPAPSPAPNQDP
jgi:hypothetical protein